MKDSKIEWTHHTANLWWGCTKVHEGCDNCYAETLAKRWKNDIWGNDKPRKEVRGVWNDLLNYQKLAKEAGEIHRVFVGSMMDIFEKPMPLINSKGEYFHSLIQEGKVEATTGIFRDIFFRQISENKYPNLMFLLLTKRPSNINKYIPESWHGSPLKNVMFGISPVNQKTFNDLTGQLMKINGKKFLSVEPQLDFISVETIGFTGIDWIIQGGESGHHKRPFNLEWARSMKDECSKLSIPYFFKQIDKIQEIPEDLQVRQFPA